MQTLGVLADFVDLDGRTSLCDLVIDQFAAHAVDYDLGAVTADYRSARSTHA